MPLTLHFRENSIAGATTRNHDPRIVLGIAKQYATAHFKAHIQQQKAQGSAVGFDLCILSLNDGEGIWGKRSHPEPIRDARHYSNTFKYIAAHEQRGTRVLVPDLTCIIQSG